MSGSHYSIRLQLVGEREEEGREKEEEDKDGLRSWEERGRKAIFLSCLMGTQILHVIGEIPHICDGLEQ